MDMKEVLLLWFIHFLTSATNKFAGSGVKQNQQLAEILNQLVYSSFKDNIWGGNLADMQLISRFRDIIFFYYVLLIFLVNMHQLFL